MSGQWDWALKTLKGFRWQETHALWTCIWQVNVICIWSRPLLGSDDVGAVRFINMVCEPMQLIWDSNTDGGLLEWLWSSMQHLFVEGRQTRMEQWIRIKAPVNPACKALKILESMMLMSIHKWTDHGNEVVVSFGRHCNCYGIGVNIEANNSEGCAKYLLSFVVRNSNFIKEKKQLGLFVG